MEQQPQVEILVHIGAPSKAADDAWYRSLATSYIDFQPANHVDPFSQTQLDTSNNGGRSSLEPQEKDQGAIQDISLSLPSSQPFGNFESPQASFKSVIDNADSPRVPARRTPEAEPAENAEGTPEQAMQSSWQTPSSMVQDSYQVGNNATISMLTSPTRVLESYLQHFESPLVPTTVSQETGNSASHPNILNSSHPHTIKDKRIASLTPATPQIVPCTPRYRPSSTPTKILIKKSEARSEGQVERSQIPQQDEIPSDNIIEETIIMESSDPSSNTRADSEPPPAKRHQPDTATTSPRALLRAASDVGPRSASNQGSILSVAFLSDHGYTYDSLHIMSPEPDVSVDDVDAESFITPGLERLARDLDISKRYKPKELKRDLRPFERGYWWVDCSAWEPQLKHDTWAYLANYVGTGVAGWGVWCARDADFQAIRVYCWGSIVAHVYLLLYLATQRKIRYTQSTWNDGGELPVIIMEVK